MDVVSCRHAGDTLWPERVLITLATSFQKTT